MRHTFGQSLTDWTMSIGPGDQVLVAGGATVTFWNVPTTGTQYTSLLDGAGNPVTSIISADGTGALPTGTIPQFQGPDGITHMWADAGGGARFLMVATDIGDQMRALDTRVSALEPSVADLAASPTWVRRDPASGVWPARPETGRVVIWLDTLPDTPLPPAIGGTGMVDNLDLYFGSA